MRVVLTAHQFCLPAGMLPLRSTYLSILLLRRNSNLVDLYWQRMFSICCGIWVSDCGIKIKSRPLKHQIVDDVQILITGIVIIITAHHRDSPSVQIYRHISHKNAVKGEVLDDFEDSVGAIKDSDFAE